MNMVEQWQPGATEVTVWDLEMATPEALKPRSQPQLEATLLKAAQPAPELSRFFYQLVGSSWHWTDREPWTIDQWLAWVDQPGHQLVTCWCEGVPAGYFELEAGPPSTTRLAYFGLTPNFIGRGLGGWLLTQAVQTAWAIPGTERLILDTCSLDGPHAMANYRSRGFTIAGERTEWRML